MNKTFVTALTLLLITSPAFAVEDDTEKAEKQETQTMQIPAEGLTAYEVVILQQIDKMINILRSNKSEDEITKNMADVVSSAFKLMECQAQNFMLTETVWISR